MKVHLALPDKLRAAYANGEPLSSSCMLPQARKGNLIMAVILHVSGIQLTQQPCEWYGEAEPLNSTGANPPR